MNYIQIPKVIRDRIFRRKDGCWEWYGSFDGDGWPQVAMSHGSTQKVIPLLFRMQNPALPNRRLRRKISCNTSKKGLCVNPNHYELTQERPKIRMPGVGKGRNPDSHANPAKGEQNGMAKITVKTVETIRSMATGTHSAHSIIKHLRLKISATQVNRIIKKKNWRHV